MKLEELREASDLVSERDTYAGDLEDLLKSEGISVKFDSRTGYSSEVDEEALGDFHQQVRDLMKSYFETHIAAIDEKLLRLGVTAK